MMKFGQGVSLCLVALLAACGAESSPADPAAVAMAQTAPTHPADATWAYPDSLATSGRGPCVGVSLGQVLDQIRERFEVVRDIRDFRPSGPRGVPLNPGPATPAGAAPAPATASSAFVVGYVDDRSFGATFFRGAGCRGDQCQDRQYWYFETDQQCQPRWVGQHRAIDRAGGRYGTCVEVAGAPLWSFPAEPGARQRCDADWSPRDISGTRQAFMLDPAGTCSASQQKTFVPVDVTIIQGTDLAQATVTLRGTGVPFVDERAFSGRVERLSLGAVIEETTTGACPVRRQFRIDFDFEEPSNNGLPGGFGVVDITETPLAPCATGPASCTASMHFIHAR